MKILRSVRLFLRKKLWQDDLESMTGWRRFGFALGRVVAHVVAGFRRNLTGVRAASLTLVTLLALVPGVHKELGAFIAGVHRRL